MKLKKMLASILCTAMVLSTMNFSVSAAEANTLYVDPTSEEIGVYTTLKDAAVAAQDGDTIVLAEGEYVITGVNFGTVTVKAAEDATVVIDVPDHNGATALPHQDNDAEVTFENVTLDFYPNGNYNGLQYNKITYNNCTIEGNMFLYGLTFDIFNNCTFNQNDSNNYNVWTYGSKYVEFNGCTFNSEGKSVLVYNEGYNGTELLVEDCDFIANNPVDGKAAIEIDSSLLKSTQNYAIKVDEKTTSDGFATGSLSGNTLWNVKKASCGGDTSVVVNNDVVYARAAGTTAEEPVIAMIGNDLYTSIADAFAALQGGEILELLDDVTLTEEIWVINQDVLNDFTLDGNGHTITAEMTNPDDSVLYFGSSSQSKWCTGIEIKDLTIEGTAKYAIFFTGGTSSILTNVNITGNYDPDYGAVIFYGTHGGTLTNCNIISGFANGQGAWPLNLVNSKFEYLIANNTVPYAGVAVNIDENSSIDKLFVGGSSTNMVNSLENVASVEIEDGAAIATTGGVMYADLQEAIDATSQGDIIDLGGATIDLPEVNSLKITKSLEIKNGTIDITDGVWNGNSIIEVYGGTEGNPVVLTMTDVDVIGDNYSSAFGIIYAYNHGKVVLNNCDFTLSNEQYSAGGVLKGNGISVSAFDVTGGVFNLENPNRIIANATVNLNGVDIDAKVTDETLVPGTMNNHAFRNVVGTITDSNIVADGFETGIKNDNGVDLNIDGTSSVTLKNSVDKDLILKNNTKVIVADTALLYAENVQIEEDSVDGDVVDEYTTAPVITPNAQAFRGKSDTITITCEEEGAKIYYTTDGTNPTLASTLYTAGFSVSQTCEVKAIALVDGKMTSEITTASFVEKTTSSSNGSTGSSSPSTPSVVYYTVKFVTNSDTTINDVKVKENSVIAAPATFEKEGYIFDGWYKDADFSEAYDFDAKVTKNFTLYAKWTEEKTEDDKTEEDNKEEDKTDVTNPEENTPSDETDMNFTDVSEDFWGYEGIKYCYDSGIMNGVKEETFEPNRDASRAMLITMLYRLAGEPEITTDGTEWYSKAQAWAKDNDISDGTNMDASITREQLVTILYRYVSKKTEVSATADLSIFADSDEISDYAIEAMKWAVENGIITGVGNGNLAPKQTATRAQIATIFARAKDIL